MRNTITFAFLLPDARAVDDKLMAHVRACLEPLDVTSETKRLDGGVRIEARLGTFTLLPSQGAAILATDETLLARMRDELEPLSLEPSGLLSSLALVLQAPVLGALASEALDVIAALRANALGALAERAVFAGNAARLQGELLRAGADDNGTFASRAPM